MDGNNSSLMKEIMNDERAMRQFMKYALAKPEDKPYYRSVRTDDGRLHIILIPEEMRPKLNKLKIEEPIF